MYTPLVRAEILYKHLYFSDISLKHLVELVKEQRYLKIIDHQNYNPRIIEAILDKKEWKIIPPTSYYGLFSSYFDNPESVWRHAFEQQISPLGRIIVIILGSINELVELEYLKKAVKSYLETDRITYTGNFNIDFEGALKELAGSFIKIEKDDNNTYSVEYFNPSVADFIHKYFISHIDI